MQLIMRKPDDWHVHLREGDVLNTVLPYTARNFKRALVMPNLKEPITSASEAIAYKARIKELSNGTSFEPVMTLKLWKGTAPEEIRFAAGIAKAVKLYPDGVTTNSNTGINEPMEVNPKIYEEMVKAKMVFCIHAEAPDSFCLDREKDYLPAVHALSANYPDLKIVLEHVTTAEGVRFVMSHPNMAATITPHHLAITLDDLIGDKLEPHNFCKPVAKHYSDRDALQHVAFHGHTQFFLGTDSAPHVQGTKECASGCAGCFTSPIAIPLLAQLFAKEAGFEALERFMSGNGAKFYDMPLNIEAITLTRRPFMVPSYIVTKEGQRIVPFMAGQTLEWSVEGS
jgi:dihydroorotase